MSFDGERDIDISGISFDSRKVKKDHLFVAVNGLTVDGHSYINQAIENGAIAIVCEVLPSERDKSIIFIETDNSSKALGTISSNFFGNPSSKLKLVGVTGTNGKTTSVTLLHKLFSGLGYKVGMLSTVENMIGEEVLDSSYTTPDAVQLNQLLAEMLNSGCTHAFMEVSSHALVQDRVAGIHFSGGVFSNISHDHLDYHGSFDEYIAAKKLLFDGLPSEAFALVNTDDRRGQIMLQNTNAEKKTYALKQSADFKAKIIHNTLQGLEIDIDNTTAWFKLIGSFNAYNLLSTYAVAVLLGEDKNEVLMGLSELQAARGRFEYVANSSNVLAVVDYAHTPDALENVLSTLETLRTRNETLITVVGCGGDRDKDKRPKMAGIATKYSEKVILTTDNPRTEDPEDILKDMMEGVPASASRKTMKILDRKEAIRTACNLAGNKDIILVAGKGHETYQEVNGVRHHFDDKEVLIEILNQN